MNCSFPFSNKSSTPLIKGLDYSSNGRKFLSNGDVRFLRPPFLSMYYYSTRSWGGDSQMVRDRSNLLSATNRTTDVKKTRYPEGTHIPVNFRNIFSSRINDPVVHMCCSHLYILYKNVVCFVQRLIFVFI